MPFMTVYYPPRTLGNFWTLEQRFSTCGPRPSTWWAATMVGNWEICLMWVSCHNPWKGTKS